MSDTGAETPVQDLLATMTAASMEASGLDAQSLMLVRIAALSVLVGGGAAVYAAACFLTRAFAWDDVRLLLRRRRENP